MGIISIKCVITRVSDSRAPGPLEKRAPLLSAEARRGILSMPVNASFNATIPFSFLKADPWKFEMSPFPPFVSPFYFFFISLFPLFFYFRKIRTRLFPMCPARVARINCQEAEKEIDEVSFLSSLETTDS